MFILARTMEFVSDQELLIHSKSHTNYNQLSYKIQVHHKDLTHQLIRVSICKKCCLFIRLGTMLFVSIHKHCYH